MSKRAAKLALIVIAIVVFLVLVLAMWTEYQIGHRQLDTDNPIIPTDEGQRIAGSVPFDYRYMKEAQAVDDSGRLFLGPAKAALDSRWMKSTGITHVLNVGADYNPQIQKKLGLVSYEYIDRDDQEHVQLHEEFSRAFKYIDDALTRNSKHKVLVHCHAGVSRSATIILAYLMHRDGISSYEAISRVMERRPVILPNPGFAKQLLDFEKRTARGSSGGRG